MTEKEAIERLVKYLVYDKTLSKTDGKQIINDLYKETKEGKDV